MPALFVDELTVIDFAYFDPVRGIVGESWILDIILEGDLDPQGMVFDFGDVKKQIKIAIDSSVDHKFVVPAQYSGLSINHDSQNANLDIQLLDQQGRRYQHYSPAASVVLLKDKLVTQQAVKQLLIEKCSKVVPDNVTDIQLELREEQIDGAYYHYAHGLKKHLGDCQRIAHGHRSQIQILENGQRSESLETYWAEKWQDIYIGTQEDLQQVLEIEGISYHHFAYTSEQGDFSLTLPSDSCHMMVNDSTVELIAHHIAKQIRQLKPNSDILVKAYEGVNKGAIA